MSDHNVNAADRYFDDQESAAISAHCNKLIKIGERLDAIRADRIRLNDEERQLRVEICKAVNVNIGDIIDTGRTRYPRGEVMSMTGDIVPFEGARQAATAFDQRTVRRIARITCECAPETSPGKFHSKDRLHGVVVFDENDCAFRYSDADACEEE